MEARRWGAALRGLQQRGWIRNLPCTAVQTTQRWKISIMQRHNRWTWTNVKNSITTQTRWLWALYLFIHAVSSLSGAVKRLHSRSIHREGGPWHERTDGISPCLSLSLIYFSILHSKPRLENMTFQKDEREVGEDHMCTVRVLQCGGVCVCVCSCSKPQSKQSPEDRVINAEVISSNCVKDPWLALNPLECVLAMLKTILKVVDTDSSKIWSVLTPLLFLVRVFLRIDTKCLDPEKCQKSGKLFTFYFTPLH